MATLIANRYRVLRPLGRGATAEVFAVEDLHRGGMRLALKLLRDRDEAERLGLRLDVLTLRHPNLVGLRDLELSGKQPYLTCDLVEGPDLAGWVRGRSRDEVLDLLAALLGPLSLLHDRGWVHGDLKPANVLVGSDGEPRLIDLGMAVRSGEPAGGTLGYAAPELMTGGVATPSADIYAFGALAVEVLTDERPFGGDAPTVVERQLRGPPPLDALPAPLGELLAACLAVEPAGRPQRALAVLDALRAATGRSLAPRRVEVLPRARLVGRDTQRQELADGLDRAASGAGPVSISIWGAEGMGKSRLVAEAQTLALARGFACYIAPTLGELLAALAAAVADGAPDPTRAAMLAGLVPGTVDLAPVTSDLEAVAQSPGELGTRLRGVLFELATRAARARPTLLLLDDLHRRDEAERGAIMALVEALGAPDTATATLPLGCVVASEDPPGGATPIKLEPLDPQQVAAMVRSMLPGVEVAPRVCEEISRASDGIPWLVVESLQVWLRSGETPGEPAGAVGYPERVLQLAARRLAHLSEPQRRAAELLALSPELDPRVLHRLVGQLAPEALQALVGQRIVRERSAAAATTLTLCGDHLRQALLNDCAPQGQISRHLELAAALDELQAPAAQVALHLERAGQAGRAAARYLEAAEEGDYRGAWAIRAAALGGRAWPGHAQARRAAARSLLAAGELLEASQQLELLVEAGQAGAADRVQLAWLRDALGQPEAALELLEAMETDGAIDDGPIDDGPIDDGPIDDGARLIRARALLRLGEHDQALALCQQLPASGDVDNLVGLIEHARGELDRASAALQRARAQFEQRRDLSGLSKVAINLAVVEQARGDLASAARWYREALQQALARGDHLRAVHCRVNHATVCQLRGELGPALDEYRQAIFEARRLGHPMLADRAQLNLASLLLELGDFEHADAALDACSAGAADAGFAAFFELNRAELAASRGDFGAARSRLDAARASVAAGGDLAAEVEALLVGGRIALARGGLDEARTLARRARAAAADHGFDKLVDEALLVEAIAARRQPDCDLQRLRERLQQVVRGMEQRGEQGRIWSAYHELSAVEALLGEEIDAAFHQAKAGEIVDRLLESLPAAARQTLLRRPALRDVYAATRGRTAGEHRPAPAPAAGDAEALLRINIELARVREPEKLVQIILDRAIELAGAQRGMLILVDGDELRVAAARNIDQESIRRGRELFSENLAKEVIGSGRPLLTVDALHDARFAGFASVHEMKLRSVICAPLKIWGSVAGAIYLDNRFLPDAFTERHGRLLEGFGAQAGLALDAARLLEQERRRVSELQRAREQVEDLSQQLQQTIDRQSVELEEAVSLVRAQRQELVRTGAFAEIVGESVPIRRVLELVHKISHTEIPVYIYGESGTGKELVARAIHRSSPRKERPLVTINCGGLSPQLLASELFGHKRGAFTGATRDHPGLLRMAEGGTLFLDEVTEMTAEVQVQFLRVLQSGDYRPVGSDEALQADVRVISASNVDLDQAVGQQRFRQDLSYRLNVMRLDLPPLHERRDDIPLLIRHFLGETPIHRAALQSLLAYPWPGNVRELANELERAKALTDGEIRLEDLSEKISPTRLEHQVEGCYSGTLAETLGRIEREALLQALEQTGFNASRAAAQLGISRAGFYQKLARHGISLDGCRPEK